MQRTPLMERKRKQDENKSQQGGFKKRKMTEGQTHIVSQNGCNLSHFKTINEALQIAVSGDCISVHAGIYRESVIVDKPNITIIGTSVNHNGGPILVTEIQSPDNVVQLRANNVTLRSLKLTQSSREPSNSVALMLHHPTINCAIVENCEITSARGDCCVLVVLFQKTRAVGEEPGTITLRNNCIHHSYRSGLFVRQFVRNYKQGNPVQKLLVENNKIYGNKCSNVLLTSNETITEMTILLRNNDIHSSEHAGIWVKDCASPTIEHNQIYRNARPNILCTSNKEKANNAAIIRGNNIFERYDILEQLVTIIVALRMGYLCEIVQLQSLKET